MALVTAWIVLSGCQQPASNSASSSGSAATASSTSSSSTTSTTTSSTSSSSLAGFEIITKATNTGSFDAVSVPATGGVSVKAQRLYNLDGSLITTGNIPTWYTDARVFLTSTRTSAGTPAFTTDDTPCAYFDSYSDNNPDTSGFYTIDGYTADASLSTTDIDQCAGTAAAELNKLGLYIQLDRRFMNSTDKLQVIVKAKPLDAATTAPSPATCVVSGNFNAANCVNQLFTLTMRTAPAASANPWFNLFPSAKSLDLLSESILLPIHAYPNVTTISIDRVKGGAVFYGISVIRIP